MWIKIGTGALINLSQAQMVEVIPAPNPSPAVQFQLRAVFGALEGGKEVMAIPISQGNSPHVYAGLKAIANMLVVQDFD